MHLLWLNVTLKKDSYINWMPCGICLKLIIFRTFSICTANLYYFKILALELDCVEELCQVSNLLHSTNLTSQMTVEDLHRPVLVTARVRKQMLV